MLIKQRKQIFPRNVIIFLLAHSIGGISELFRPGFSKA